MKFNLSLNINRRMVTMMAVLFALVFTSANAYSSDAVDANHKTEKEAFDLSKMIVHHVSDAHAVHIFRDLYIPLPAIVYHKKGGLDFFMSNKLYDVTEEHGEYHLHPKEFTASSGHTYTMDSHGAIIEAGTAHQVADDHGAVDQHGEAGHAVHSNIIDFSITKSILGMFLALLIVFLVFTAAAKGYSKREGQAPKGIQNVVEPIVLFLRDELIIPSLGEKKAPKYTPFLMSMFFFIWVANLLGLIPFIGGFNVTGTLSITLVLATIVFIVTTVSGNKHYWGHIFWPPGVPFVIKLILVPIEVLSIFIKPFVLMVRLTANITAGHIIILSFVGLILMAGESSTGAGLGVAIGSVAFMVFMFFIELLVAFIQAYVFTLLTALYFGDATTEPHH